VKSKNEKFYGWIALSAAALAMFNAGGAGYTFSAFLPALNGEFGWSVGEISIALSLAMALMTLTGPLAGFMVGKFGARISIVLGNALIAGSFAMLVFHNSKWQLFMAYAILGIGSGLGSVIAAGTIASSWFVKKIPLAMSVNMGAMGLGGLVLVPASAVLIHTVGWRQTYIVLSIVAAILGVILPGLLIRNKPEDLGQFPDGIHVSPKTVEGATGPSEIHRKSEDFTLKEAMRTSAFWLLCFYSCTPFFVMMFLMGHQINFLTKNIGLSIETAGLAMGLISASSVIGTLGLGVLGLKYDVKKLTVAAMGLIILSMFLGSATHSATMAFTYSVIFGVGLGGTMVSLISLIPAYFGRAHFPKITGISGLFILLSSLGAPVGGYLYDATKNYYIAFMVCIGVSVIGLILILLVRPPVHPSLKAAKHSE
jgi:MFS transporter, OFA family, oxalate/formate antiporter